MFRSGEYSREIDFTILVKEEIISSLYHVLEEKGGHKIGAASQTISAMIASEQIADYLQIKRGDAILRMRQITCFENGQPFEYVRTQYVGNRFEFLFRKIRQEIEKLY